MLISIIVPVYNAEKYLDRCVKSVFKSLTGLSGKGEILLIDNNSSDDSLAKAKEYAARYPKTVRALQCNTPGAAAVRNYGVEQARGKYIWFIDADDEVSLAAVRDLVTAAEEAAADLTTLGLTKIYPDGHRDYIGAIHADDPEFKSKFIRRELGPVQVLIRRDWYERHNFRFLEGGIHEDMDLMPALILYTDKFASVDKPLYLYYQNAGSVLHPTEWNQHCFDIFPALTSLYARFERAGATKKYHDELEWFFIWNLLMDSAEYFGKFREGRSGFKRSREMLRKYFPHWRRNQFLGKVNFKTKLKIMLNYYR